MKANEELNPVAREMNSQNQDGKRAERAILVYCPGCKMAHRFTIEVFDGRDRPTWGWDGNMENPTFTPSLLCYSTVHTCDGEHPSIPCDDYENCDVQGHLIINCREESDPEKYIYHHTTPHTSEQPWGNCHSFLKNGHWEFLSDSAHSLAGQTVPMVPLPDWLMPRLDTKDE